MYIVLTHLTPVHRFLTTMWHSVFVIKKTWNSKDEKIRAVLQR